MAAGFLLMVEPAEARRHDAFAAFVVPEIEVLLRVARSLTGQDSDAEDLVQDTLLRAYRAIDRFDGQHPRAWLLTILRHTNINRVRRSPNEVFPDTGVLDQMTALGGSSEDQVVDRTFDAAVEGAFQSLPERFRQPVELVDLEGLSYQEAAAVLDVPVGTIMSRLHRGRDRIRRQLEASGFRPGGARE